VLFAADRWRQYWRCDCCGLIFVPAAWHLSPEEEKRRYDLHQNRLDDAGYRGFLSQLVEPLVPMLASGMEGIDFGCGPGPALARMLGERGFQMRVFDPFYALDREALARQYDFAVCTETVEHFRCPAESFAVLRGLVADDGCLGIMTQRYDDVPDFGHWRYAMDETHIAFYGRKTFEWLAQRWGWAVSFHGRNIAILTAPGYEARRCG
jgi:2-polyprenyl-3-methyl-5-hydroxy-6-metoxy-1,4-benzoquinol methylase